MLSRLPKAVRHRIYALAVPFSRIEIEVTDNLSFLTKHSSLLRISKKVREDVLDACSEDSLELVHTFRSPASLKSSNTAGITPSLQNIRVIILAWIEDNKITLKEEVLYRHDTDPLKLLYRSWREAFSTLPETLPLKFVYFDVFNPLNIDVHQPGKLLNILSMVVQRRSQGKAKCKIIGCQTVREQRFLEKQTVGVVRGQFPPGSLSKRVERKGSGWGPGVNRDYPTRSEVSAEEYERWEVWVREYFGKRKQSGRV